MKPNARMKKRLLALALCGMMCLQLLPLTALALPAEPEISPVKVEDGDGKEVTVDQYAFTFEDVPETPEAVAEYDLDTPYETMALLIMAFRTWTPDNEKTCLEMLDCLTDTGSVIAGTDTPCPFSRYTPWVDALRDRMMQNEKYRYIGNAYLGGADKDNNYTPAEPFTVTLREGLYGGDGAQVLVSLAGADSDRYCLFVQDGGGQWKVRGSSWMNLLADVQTPEMDILLPPAIGTPGTGQKEPDVKVENVPALAAGVDGNGDPIEIETTVEQYTYTFTTVPKTYEDIIQYQLDSPYKTMALYFLALRTWDPDNPKTCEKMLDYLTNPDVDSYRTEGGKHLSKAFSEHTPWTSFLKDRMTQNDKYRFIGDAYLGGATPQNNYTPDETDGAVTITLRQSTYDPYKAAQTGSPELKQVLVSLAGADNDRYGLLYQDQRGDWRFFGDNWKGLLADVKTPAMDIILPPETGTPGTGQQEPDVKKERVPAMAVDENDKPIPVEVEQYTYTFTTVPKTYEDIIQYKLDSPYKTMALYFLALRTYDPKAPETCEKMLDYLTNPKSDSGKTDQDGRKLSVGFSEYTPWKSFLSDRMKQNSKYRFIGNAYLGGASPWNDYTPDETDGAVTVTLRQSVYDPYKAGTETTPELKQVLVSIDGADNDRYGLLYKDERGDWRFFDTNWQGLLADVKTPTMDILMPPETGPLPKKLTQKEPVETEYEVPAKAPAVDDMGNDIVVDTTVKQHTFVFSTVPTNYEEIIQYKLDSPYKTMALLFLAYRTWTPENPTDCLEMLDYLTNPNVDSGKKDANGRKLSKKFSEHQFWVDFLRDRMRQNEKYRYIGNAFLEGAMPSNNYTPTKPVTITVRESVYNPYRPSSGDITVPYNAETDPTLYQVLVSIPGADNDKYSLFYQDQRGDWRVFGDNWKGLLVDIKTPSGDIPLPPIVDRTKAPETPQTDPAPVIEKVPARAVEEGGGIADTTVEQYTFTFSTVPKTYEDIIQYSLKDEDGGPYKTMALFFLALRTWTPENPETCLKMLDYLTCTAVAKPDTFDGEGNRLCYPFSEYLPWISFLKDRMTQNDKYHFIGSAYLKGATPENGYTPDSTAGELTAVVRQSVYDPYKAGTETSPELIQVLVSLAGSDSDRYALLYKDQRGDWRFYGDSWKGLLTDVQGTRITEAAVDQDKGTLTFQAESEVETALPLVATYDENGRMTGVTTAAEGEDGYTAKVASNGTIYHIFMMDTNDGAPLCQSVELGAGDSKE